MQQTSLSLIGTASRVVSKLWAGNATSSAWTMEIANGDIVSHHFYSMAGDEINIKLAVTSLSRAG